MKKKAKKKKKRYFFHLYFFVFFYYYDYDYDSYFLSFLLILFFFALVRFTFNYVVESGTTYLCVSDKDFPTRICFAFLQKLKEEYDGRPDFEQRMSQWMEYYSTNPAADKIKSVATSVEMVKTQMLDNLRTFVLLLHLRSISYSRIYLPPSAGVCFFLPR